MTLGRIMLEIRGVSKTFATEKGETVQALAGIDLTVAEQEFVCILGPSGCGKTTLLRIIAGLDRPTTGEILVEGDAVTAPSPKMAMIFQEYSLYPWRTVLDNIAFGLEVRGMERAERYSIVGRYLKLVGLEGFSGSYPYELSGGMRQRIAVARALAIEPAVLLMDEPFGALDAQTRNLMQRELLEIHNKTKKTILFVTHSVDEAVFLADRIVVLTTRPGRIREIIPVQDGRPRERTSPEFVQVRRHVLDLITEK
ncbi:MAG: ABC transporter ATP-binding protein [Methanomicrobiales archaeon]|nr:ABC transporter ATP-binding protein [Methanomicrobiales archaeon]